MLPLSFQEYLRNKEESKKEYLNYLELSSFPYALQFDDKNQVYEYLKGIYNTVILKDIVSRYNIKDITILEDIIRFIFHNIGNEMSSKKISDTLNSHGRKTDVKTVEKYIRYLKECYIIYEAKRYDIKDKKYLKSLQKYYIIDIALRYMLLGNNNQDSGHILENIIYLELIRRNYNVYIGKIDNLEIDFIAKKHDEITYFQVTLSLIDELVLQREIKPLKKINDNYEKIILTLDEENESNIDGIKIINALKWLNDK